MQMAFNVRFCLDLCAHIASQIKEEEEEKEEEKKRSEVSKSFFALNRIW
jgi:hypothetical protein